VHLNARCADLVRLFLANRNADPTLYAYYSV